MSAPLCASRARGVAMVTHAYPPHADGGAERQAQRLAHRLTRQGMRVWVVCPSHDGTLHLGRDGGVRVWRLPCLQRPGLCNATFLPALGLALAALAPRVDVIHVHQAYYPAAACIGAAALLRKPVVVKVAASGPWGEMARLAPLRTRKPVLALLRRADALIAMTADVARELRANGLSPDRFVRIVNGIDTERFRPLQGDKRAARRALGLPAAGPLALYAGRMVREKGVFDLVAAWQGVVARFPKAHLVMLGRGQQAAEVAALARDQGVAANITFAGQVDDVLPYLHAADVFVLPSYSEGLSNAVLEALAAGVPVVASDIPSLREQLRVGVDGLLAPPRDPAALRDALVALFADPARRRAMARAGRQAAEQVYSMDATTRAYWTLYDRLAGRAPLALGA